MVAQLIEIRNQRDVDHLIFTSFQIEQPKVRAALIDDAALGKRRRLNIETALMGMLLQISAVLVHRVDVHDSVTVGKKIHAAFPSHRIIRGAGPVPREQHGFGTGFVAPDVFRGAALVAFRRTGLALKPREEERLTIRRVAARGCLSEGNNLFFAVGIDDHQFRVGKRGVTLGSNEQAPIRSPPGRDGISVPGAPLRQAPIHGHGVHIDRTFVLRAECHRLPVRRNHCIRLLARV
jgi:hypothetical protein